MRNAEHGTNDDQLTLLHISDIHFGMKDMRGEMDRISESLVRATQEYSVVPDVCVFSGDMAFSGKKEEFELGTRWLEQLLKGFPETKLVVVPGNHDVDRERAAAVLRQSFTEEHVFYKNKEKIKRNLGHLEGFFNWVRVLHETFGDRLLTRWEQPMLTHGKMSNGSRDIKFIGLNTALLSQDDEDLGKLVQDVAALNSALGKSRIDEECVIVVGHHPLDWLTSWNENLISGILRQKNGGAHVYMHGHRHESAALAFANGVGQNLATLECGAAYQGSDYSQFYAYHTLEFGRFGIQPNTFAYAKSSGKWVPSSESSERFTADLPGQSAKKTKTLAKKSQATIEALPLELAHPAEDDLVRLVESAASSSPDISVWPSPLEVRIGLRENQRSTTVTVKYVLPFHADISTLAGRLVKRIISADTVGGKFDPAQIKVFVVTSRLDSDPLSLSQRVKDAVGISDEVHCHVRTRDNGASYVYFDLLHRQKDVQTPVKLELCSFHEEHFGQLEELVRVKFSKGSLKGNALQKYLSVLRGHANTVIDFTDLIREQIEPPASNVVEAGESSFSFSSSDTQLSKLSDLPGPIYANVVQAFKLWDAADASRQFGGETNKFRRAAEAFAEISVRDVPLVGDLSLRTELHYIARTERSYMLMCTEEASDLVEATGTYLQILDERPEDPITLLRLGQVFENRSEPRHAIDYFRRAAEAAKPAGGTGDPIIADSASLNEALCNFRIFETPTTAREARIVAIRSAIEVTKAIVTGGRNEKIRKNALNNMVYYAWEERNFIGKGDEPKTLEEGEYHDFSIKLIDSLKDKLKSLPSYREGDTLVRIQYDLNMKEEARKTAEAVCKLLEKAARERGGDDALGDDPLYEPRWTNNVTRWLRNNDEREAFYYALKIVQEGTS